MPFRRKTGFRHRRSGFSRRRFHRGGFRRTGRRVFGRKRMSRPTTKVIRAPTGISDRVFVKLRWSNVINFIQTAGAAAVHTVKLNGINEPDGTNHLPYGSNQWDQFYQNYRVHGSKITVRPSYPDSAGTGSSTITVVPLNNGGDPVLTADYPLDEMPYRKWITSNPYNIAGRSTEITSYMSTCKIFGVDKQTVRSEDGYAAPTFSNKSIGAWGDPVNIGYWLVVAFPSNGTDSITMQMAITVEYYIEFFNRTTLAFSVNTA